MIFLIIIQILFTPAVVFGSYFILRKINKYVLQPEILLSLSSLTIALLALLLPLTVSHFEKKANELALFCTLRSELQRNIAINDALKVFTVKLKENLFTTAYANFSIDLSLRVLETPGLLDDEIKNELAALTLVWGSTNNALESAWLSSSSTDKMSTYLKVVEPNIETLATEMDWLLKKIDSYNKKCNSNLGITYQ